MIATTRSPERESLLRDQGARHVVVDTGELAREIRSIYPDGLDAALELVGADTLTDTLRTVKRGGTVCFTGALNGTWTTPEFSPFELVPTGVRLTVYGGEAKDLPEKVFAQQLEAISSGRMTPVIAAVYRGLKNVVAAQAALEGGNTPGKHVVVISQDDDSTGGQDRS